MRYTVLLDRDPEGAGYTVTVPSLPGCITEGATLDEALANAREAITCHVEGLLASADEVPREKPTLISLVVEVRADSLAPVLAG